MIEPDCSHLDKIVDAEKSYQLVLAYYVTCIAEDASKRKAFDALCRLCQKNNRRIHACLECAFFGCFDHEDGEKSHMEQHYFEKKHCFAININHGCLFCFKCDDYIYNETFEDIFNEYKLEAIEIAGYRPYMPWKPKAEEIVLLKDKIKKVADDSYIGLRGIINFDESCYASVIIHVLIHNPVLRDFFLSDQHSCFLKEKCLTCEMFVLFQEFYSGIEAAYDPSKRFFVALQDIWTFGGQHDAFEFFQVMLTGLHDSCEKTHSKEMHDCNCLIHQTFYGIEQGSRSCDSCEASSTSPLEHFVDILLDSESEDDSLVKLLNRKYLEPQLLSDHKCSCSKIGTTHLYHKIKKLPTVICIRMNCFKVIEGRTTKKEVRKKSTAFAFDEWIDMSPYVNSKEHNKLAIENMYQLYAVIFHKSEKGVITEGHYSVFVRQRRNKWYEIDDHRVFKQSLKVVLNCNPVLLLYCKQM